MEFSWLFASRREHGPTWYLTGMIVVLSLVIYGITQGLYLMSVATFLFAGVYILIENNSLPTTEVHINHQRILVGTTIYDYNNIARFAIISIANIPSYLRINEKKRLSTSIDIPLSSDINPQALREHLLQYIEEDTTATFSNSDALIHAMRL